MPKETLNIAELISQSGCFDLQFRKDTRHERTNSPTYYRWKAQFIVTLAKSQKKTLQLLQKSLGCGNIHESQNQARFSVQKIDEVYQYVIPFLKTQKLSGTKKQECSLWQKAADILMNNKGKHLAEWKKTDLKTLLEIQKSLAKYKNNPKQSKWAEMANLVAK